jgi:glycosyltransferase involved in cell wall biosynthesis
MNHSAPPVMYVLKRYPRLSETFIVRELLGLEAAGRTVLVDSLLPDEGGPRHPDVDAVRADVRYVARHPRLWHGRVLAAHAALFARGPRRWTALAWRARPGRSPSAWRRFLQAGLVAQRARRHGVAVIHAHFATAAAEVARDASQLSGIPFTVTAHAKDIYHDDYAVGLPARVRSAAAVVTVSRHNVAHLRERLPQVDIRYIPNGVALCDPAPDQPAGSLLFVGRLVAKKGVDTLLEAMAVVHRRVPGARLQIVGDGPQRPALEAQAQRLGISSVVRFCGALAGDDVDDAYRRAVAVVAPCRVDATGDRDGLPTVLLEAMARGVAVISTSVVGIPELIAHGETGLLAPPDDPGALAEAILQMVGDAPLRQRLAAAGRATVAHRYAPAASTEALIRLHQSVSGMAPVVALAQWRAS